MASTTSRRPPTPRLQVFPLNVPALCSSCHSDAQRMQPYGIPTDQFDVYSKSVHGVALLTNKDTRAPSCASCHGSHDAQPPTSATVVEVCGKCHTATQKLYEESRHSQLPAATPQCWTCHGWHDVSQPSSDLFFHQLTPNYTCDTCHDLQTHKLRIETVEVREPGRPAVRHLPPSGLGHLRAGRGHLDRRQGSRGRLRQRGR